MPRRLVVGTFSLGTGGGGCDVTQMDVIGSLVLVSAIVMHAAPYR
jgi:hypothetical protein